MCGGGVKLSVIHVTVSVNDSITFDSFYKKLNC